MNDTWVKSVQFGFYIPILAAGFPLNVAALWQLFFHVRRWNESTVYLLNLIISDCLLLFALPFKIMAYGQKWNLGRFACSLFESLVYVNMYGSILLSVCISVDRYVALQFPFQRLRSKRKAALVCAVMWMLLFGFSCTVYDLHEDSINASFCFQNFSNHTWKKQWIVVCVECVFWGSTVVMVLCSVLVIKILHDLRKRNPNDAKLRNNKSVKIVLSNLVVFLLCFIPYHIAVLIYFYVKLNEHEHVIDGLRKFVHISLCVSSVNCLADAVCYYFILKENLQIAQQDARANTLTQSTHLSAAHTLIQSIHTYPENAHSSTAHTETHTKCGGELCKI